MQWTKEAVTERLARIQEKGYIPIPEGMFRIDDGIVGQILEREFGVEENNLHLADLGVFELKGLRYKKNRSNLLTLFHQTSAEGMSPRQIFDRFGYVRKSRRSDALKKKLFTTIRGDRSNNLGFVLRTEREDSFMLYHKDEYLATWDLSASKDKIRQIILVYAETQGKPNSREERFHYFKGYLLSELGSLSDAVRAGAVSMDLCIDQPVGTSGSLHDRGPHIRISLGKLPCLFHNVERLL